MGKRKVCIIHQHGKAFDTVNRETLSETISDEYYSLPPELVQIMTNMYLTDSCGVRNPGSESGWLEIMTAVKQGDVISLLLFIFFMDKCMRIIRVGRYHEETLVYTDGMAVVEDSITDLQNILHQWHQEMSHKRMKIYISNGKTGFISITRISEEYNVYLGSNKLSQVEEYMYLGIKLDSVMNIEFDNPVMKYNINLRLIIRG